MSNSEEDTPLEIIELKQRIEQLINGYKNQAEFGRAVGLERSLVSALKVGRIKNLSFQLLYKIAEGTGCDAEWLLTGEGDPYPSIGTGTQRSDQQKEPGGPQSQNKYRPLIHELLPDGERPKKDREFLLLLRQLIDNYLS